MGFLVAYTLVTLALLADTMISVVLGWRPEGAMETGGVGIIAIMPLACGVLWWRHGWVAPRQGEGFLLLAGSCAALVVVEAGVHWIPLPREDDLFHHSRGPLLHQRVTPQLEYLPGITGVAHFVTDAQGFRVTDAAPAEPAVRIVAVGGSTTECVYLDGLETWPARVEAALLSRGIPAWVGNAGISGFSTHEHLPFVSASPFLRGVDVVVFQAGINDLWRYLAGEERAMDYGRFAEAPVTDRPRDLPPRTPLWSRARIIAVIHHLRREPPAVEVREGVGGEEYRIRREKRSAAGKTESLPDLEPGALAYGARIRGLIEACRRRGITPVFTTQPVIWDARSPADAAARCWFGWLPDGRYLTLGALRAAMDRWNATIRAVCAEEGVALADLDFMNGNLDYFYDDCHFTEAGAVAAAEPITDAVARALAARE